MTTTGVGEVPSAHPDRAGGAAGTYVKDRGILQFMEISKDWVVAMTPQVVTANLGEEVVVLDLKEGIYFGLGSVGARIWTLLQEPVAVHEIERVLLEEYDVEAEECHEEVLRVISQLIEWKLVEVRNS